MLAAFYALGAASLALMGYIKSTELLFVVVFVVGASTLGTAVLRLRLCGRVLPNRRAIYRRGLCRRCWAPRRDPRADPDRRPGRIAVAARTELHGHRVAGLIGAVAVMMINHRLFASTHHFDATLETVAFESRHGDSR